MALQKGGARLDSHSLSLKACFLQDMIFRQISAAGLSFSEPRMAVQFWNSSECMRLLRYLRHSQVPERVLFRGWLTVSEVREGSHRPTWGILCAEEFPDGRTTRQHTSLVREVITFVHWRVLKIRHEHLCLGKPVCGAGPGLDGLFRILTHLPHNVRQLLSSLVLIYWNA